MEKIITYSFQEDFIKNLTDFVDQNYIKKNRDISKLAFVFGGRRPALFLKKALAERFKKGFLSPKFFSIDDLVEYILQKKYSYTKINDLDACFLIYNLARTIDPAIIGHRDRFYQFLPWAQEILSFIEQLDLEATNDSVLNQIQKSSHIGYDVPESINTILTRIISLRHEYHEVLKEKGMYARGFMYLLAKDTVGEIDLNEFDSIFFCNFFYFHKTEELIIKEIYKSDKAYMFFQGDQSLWPVLDKVSKIFSHPIKPKATSDRESELKLYCGFDVHSQASLVKEILKGISDREDTVIVLPDTKSLIPLLSEISSVEEKFNVSMGYPLMRSSLCALLQLVMQAQTSQKNGQYYTKDYLRLLGHPLVKNLKIFSDATVLRILIHRIEEIMIGIERTDISGSLFISLQDLERVPELFQMTVESLASMDIAAKTQELKDAIETIHDILCVSWEGVKTFSDFARSLDKFLHYFIDFGVLDKYPVNVKVSQRLIAIKDDLSRSSFCNENFSKDEIFKIFENILDKDLISFSGSPLRGLQILGLFETRSLNFENVIIMDVNESILPKLRIYEPLIPREVTIALGLDRLEKEEEIQRYQFLRLISAAKHVHLIYQQSKDKEKSRFIEDLIWQRQKQSKSLEVMAIPKTSYKVKVLPKKIRISKTLDTQAALRTHTYSASSIDTYVECPLRFYYQYVLGLREREELSEDPDGSQVGSFIHEFLEDAFKKYLGVRPVIDRRFREHFNALFEKKFEEDFRKRMKSDAFMLKKIMQVRFERFLDNESKRDVDSILGLETDILDSMPLCGHDMHFKGRVDRIDKLMDGSILVIDYKSGSDDPMPRSLERIQSLDLSRKSIKTSVKSFQLPLYIYFVAKMFADRPLNAGIYYLRTAEIKQLIKPKDFSVDSCDKIIEVFQEPLEYIMQEILNINVPFIADDTDPYVCKNCPFFYLCR